MKTKTYFLSLLGAAFLAAVVGVLAPDGSGGVGKHLRLLSALVVLCVVAAPLPRLVSGLRDLPGRVTEIIRSPETDPETRSDDTLNAASRAYFAQALTAKLAERFSLRTDEIQCAIRWSPDGNDARPISVTLILTGSARWKDPREMEQYVRDLLGCPCDTAIA